MLELYKEDAVFEQPLIIAIHGLSGKKEDMIECGFEFAYEGYHLCFMDAFMHGELKPDNINDANDYYNLQLKQFFDIHIETARSINHLIDSYINCKVVDTNRVGLIGFSFGGLVIFKYLADFYRPNVKAAIPVLGSPIWMNLITGYMKAMNRPDYADKAELKYLKDIEPFNHINNIKNVPLLLLNGQMDNIISINDVRNTYNTLKKNYINKEHVKSIEFPGIGHQSTDEMMNEAKIWFNKYLK